MAYEAMANLIYRKVLMLGVTAVMMAACAAPIIWAHAGLYLSPSVIGEFLRDFPNLYFDLALTHATGAIRGRGHSFILLGEVIDDGWRQLFESYPDRFLVGFDFGQRGITKSMAKDVGEYFRTMLTQLTSTTARKIAYENAARLYKFR